MTPKRKAALQWIHDQGEVTPEALFAKLSRQMVNRMHWDQQIIATGGPRKGWVWHLTDWGRRDLHEAGQ